MGVPARVDQLDGPDFYWRVPIVESLTGTNRQVGFFDFKEDEEKAGNGKLVRYGLPQSRGQVDLARSPLSVTEMSRHEIEDEVKTRFGDEWKIDSEPQLVYIIAETRIAWQCILVRASESKRVFVTPGYAFVE